MYSYTNYKRLAMLVRNVLLKAMKYRVNNDLYLLLHPNNLYRFYEVLSKQELLKAEDFYYDYLKTKLKLNANQIDDAVLEISCAIDGKSFAPPVIRENTDKTIREDYATLLVEMVMDRLNRKWARLFNNVVFLKVRQQAIELTLKHEKIASIRLVAQCVAEALLKQNSESEIEACVDTLWPSHIPVIGLSW